MSTVKPTEKPRTFAEWDAIRLQGRGGKKKIRRDTLLMRDGDMLVFTFSDKVTVATLDENDVYTLHRIDDGYYYPTLGNVFMLIASVSTYSDASHYKHFACPVRIAVGRWSRNRPSLPFITGLRFQYNQCLNPEIAIDYNRKLNREKSLPWLRKTNVLAKILRVCMRMEILERDKTNRVDAFENVNIEDPTVVDAEILLRRGGAKGIYKLHWTHTGPEQKQEVLKRCAENGLADYREWLYEKHGCYEMVAIKPQGEWI